MAAARKRKRSRNARRSQPPGGSAVWVPRALYALLAFFGIGELSGVVWLGAVSEQVRVYLLPILWVLAALATRRRTWLPLALTFMATGLALVQAWPLLRPVDGTPGRGPELRLTTLSLDGHRPSDADLARWLRAETADLIVLARAPHDPEQRIRGTAGYRSLTVRPGPRGTTLTLLTRLRLLRRPVRGKDGAVRTALEVDGCPASLTYVSLPAVWNATRSSARREAFEAFDATSGEGAHIWAGDFGGDLRAPGPRTLMARAQLRDSRLGRGRHATWPLALGSVGIAMDHILVGGWVAVRERSTGEPPEGAPRRSARAKLQLTSPDCGP